MVVHAFNLSTGLAEGGSLSLRPALSTKLVPGQPGLHKETPAPRFCLLRLKLCMFMSVFGYMHECDHEDIILFSYVTGL